MTDPLDVLQHSVGPDSCDAEQEEINLCRLEPFGAL